MAYRLYYILILAVFLLLMQGCVWISMHGYYPTRMEAHFKDNKQPASMLPVSVKYWYDSYGVFYDLRKPKDISSKTDEKGVAILELADYSGGINIYVGDTGFSINQKVVLIGGHPKGYPLESKPESYREIELKIYPIHMQAKDTAPRR